MNVKLLIENQDVELTDEVKFAITKTFQELSDPTTIINDWSKTVNIPFSDWNNRLFGGIFAPNRMVAYNDGNHSNIGIYFDPTKKLDFKLLWNGDLVMNGYAKMNAIKRIEGNGTYEITLNGKLGFIFQELKKLACYTSKEIEDDPNLTDYDLTNEITGTITKESVYNSWTQERTDDDVIGFACSNDGYNKDFNSGNVQTAYDSDTTFEKLLEERYADGTHKVSIDPSTLVGDGLLPRSFGEYRSYYQRPYIYIPKMFALLKKKMQDIGIDYELVLHPKWFNPNNHYYHNLVMMLNRISDSDTKDKYNNSYSFQSSELYKYYGGENYDTSVSTGLTYTVEQEKYEALHDNKFDVPEGYFVTFNSDISFDMAMFTNGNTLKLKDDNGLVIMLRTKGQNGQQSLRRYIVVSENVDKTRVTLNSYNGIIYVSESGQLKTDGQFHWYFTIPLSTFATSDNYGTYVEFEMSMIWKYDRTPTTYVAGVDHGTAYTRLTFSGNTMNASYMPSGSWNRSYARYDFKDLWDNEHNFFDTILKYTKLFRLTWVLDETTRKLTILPTDEYFRNHTKTDWGYKLDMNRDFIITPCTMDSKYISLGYEDSETKLCKEYLTKYGINFGDCKFYTYYDFNTDTKKLIEGIKSSIVNTSVGLDWNNLYDAVNNSSIVHFQNYETKPYFATDDNDSIDPFGTYFFYRGLKEFDTNLRAVHITDDTIFQISNEEFMYIDPNAEYSIAESCMVRVYTYPWLDIIDTDGHMCTFNRPMVSYDINNDYSGANVTTIYTNFWEAYINERYNLQNNKVECYLYLTPMDFIDFRYNHFVIIEGRCYIINQISDYDVTENQPTKVELVSIFDIEGYDKVNYQYPDYLFVEPDSITLSDGRSITVKVQNSRGKTTQRIISGDASAVTLESSYPGEGETTYFTITGHNSTLVDKEATINFLQGRVGAQLKVKVIGNRPAIPV